MDNKKQFKQSLFTVDFLANTGKQDAISRTVDILDDILETQQMLIETVASKAEVQELRDLVSTWTAERWQFINAHKNG